MSEHSLLLDGRQLTLGQVCLTLTGPETAVVAALVAEPGRVLTKAELLHIGWHTHDGSPRRLDTALVRLNAALRPVAGATVFQNIWGVGYRVSATAGDHPR